MRLTDPAFAEGATEQDLLNFWTSKRLLNQDEIDYLIEHEGRNRFIRNLACDVKGNTLVLFNYVERHGEPLYNLINSHTDRPVFLSLIHI